MAKCALVTGGASGIGEAIAVELATLDHNVVIADVDAARGETVAARTGGFFVPADLADRRACRHLIEAVADRHGGVDILVNNAGFQHVAPLPEFPEEVWETMFRVMVTAPFLLMKYAWPHMQRSGWGRVVNIGSIHSMVASPNKAGYVSAKHALLGLTRTAALEGGPHGITVNAICPAYVRTPLVEGQLRAQAAAHGMAEEEVVERIMLEPAAVKRLIEPAEIASVASYLCSDRAASISGACWTVDGGWTAR